MAHRQLNHTFSIYVFAMLMLLTLLPPANVASLACNACGPECANACGTVMFRACCFNYNRKSSEPIEVFDNTAPHITAKLSDGMEGTSKLPEESFGKFNPLFKNFLEEKWRRIMEKASEEKRLQHYHRKSYY